MPSVRESQGVPLSSDPPLTHSATRVNAGDRDIALFAARAIVSTQRRRRPTRSRMQSDSVRTADLVFIKVNMSGTGWCIELRDRDGRSLHKRLMQVRNSSAIWRLVTAALK